MFNIILCLCWRFNTVNSNSIIYKVVTYIQNVKNIRLYSFETKWCRKHGILKISNSYYAIEIWKELN